MQVCHYAKYTPKMIDLCYNEYSHISGFSDDT